MRAVRKYWQNRYKRKLHTSQGSVFHWLFVKDDLSTNALAFTWWAPQEPKLEVDDKKGEEDDDTGANIGRRRVRLVNDFIGGQGGGLGFWRKTLWITRSERRRKRAAPTLKTSWGGGIVIVEFFGKLVEQQQLLWGDPGPWGWQVWKGSQIGTLPFTALFRETY